MRYLNKFKHHGNEEYIFVDIAKYGFDRKTLIENLSEFKEFMETFECDSNEIVEILDKLSILDKHLFDYSVMGTNDNLLISTDDVYTEKWVKGYLKKSYHKVYISSYQYLSLVLNKVAKELVKRNMPFLFEKPFIKIQRRFDESINNLPKSTSAKLDDIDVLLRLNNNLTIDDIIKLYTIDGYKDSMIGVPTFEVYASGLLGIDLDDDKISYSISTTYKELKHKDWEQIKKKKVFSIPLYDKMGKVIKDVWYNGKQENAPYFGFGERFEAVKNWCESK